MTATRGGSGPLSVAGAVLLLAGAGAAGGVLYNVLAPRGIFHPEAVVAAPPPPVLPAPKPAPVRRRVKPGVQPETKAPEGPAEIRIIDLAEARRHLDARDAVFVDARSPIGYEFAHIPGALNLPFSDFDPAFAKDEPRLPRNAPIVVYCTSGSCDEADITLEHLKAKGFRRLMHFKEGWNAWEIAEYPQAKGPEPR